MIHAKQIRLDFPVFKTYPSLVYLDSAATSLKPQSVIDKLTEYYCEYPANIHRGIYHVAERATEEYEETRRITSLFINAQRPEEIVFTKNSTEGFNLLAYVYESSIQPGDEIVVTRMEHHANLIPWQQLAKRTGSILRILEIDSEGKLLWDKPPHALASVINAKSKIFAMTYVSNMLGTVNPVKEIIHAAKKINPRIITIIDAAQAVPHVKVNVQDLGCDFLVFSGHKMLGPTGVGVLWGKYELFQTLPPYQTGGGMIRAVRTHETEFDQVPSRFEAGTPDIASIIALKSAIQYLEYIGFEAIHLHEVALTKYAMDTLQSKFGEKIKIYGPHAIADRGGIVTFSLEGIHPHDIAQILDEDQIAVRAGHHCTQPLHSQLGVAATTRASFYIYNNEDDVDRMVSGLEKAIRLLRSS